ncbi:glutathione S-transferase T2-like [Forsythia ovata]|uniref:Glutathione S-transferase T2-like n=1 Tax=Forsythia ovata TaxID=205694 RepID=A0ABD1VDQ8_9LAMI
MGVKCNNVRNTNNLGCRWGKIQGAVIKFHRFYERLERHLQSGTSPEDMKREAMRMYEDYYNGKSFKYNHCWEIMIKNPKWCSKRLTKTNGSSKQKVDNNISPTIDEPFSNLGDDFMAFEGINSNGAMHPQGRKGCKEKKRRLNDEKGVVDALNKLQCTLEKQIIVNRKELEMKRDR